MDPSNKGQRERDDLELASMSSGISSKLSSTEGSINTISSGDISTTSGSSGEIPTSVVVPRDVDLAREELNMMAIVTEREKCVGRNNKGVSWGYTSVIGRRKEMEDAVAVIPCFMSRTCNHVGGCMAPGSRTSSEISPIHFFGVYDGHGGSQVANFCKERMHEVILEEWDRDQTIHGCEWQRRWEATFSSGFGRADNEVLTQGVAPEMVGSTAVVVVLSGCQIITSNCGDSRAVLLRRTEAIPLTVDHKPDRSDELMRIEGQGGRVINWNGARVLGVLAMSRAIGDRYLRPWIIPVPEVTFMTRTDEDECLILASDGLWDVMTNEEVGEVARRILRRWRRSSDGFSPAQTVADNLQEIAYGRNSSDNISIIVVDLKKRRRQVRQSRGD
ncbi:PREDICTED: probable protein phosphatase 2C 6 isoform X2 [Populus euphratica]|uniref:protein-serine/threonine phosphatase n=1 Tax=Populus euphratica TaxID=75702 RepID=A0AAJ6XBK4_POPEU|nr:PREDICTED: probable protein phosphatase 2C 6 isoform X2 [Populus euphratica]